MVTAPHARAPAPQDAAARKNAPRDESGSQQQRPADALDRLQRWSATVAAGAGEALPWVHRGAAVGQAGSTLAREILALVRGMHGTIQQAPLPFAQRPEGRLGGISGLVYDCIDTGFAGVERAFATATRPLPAQAPAQWLAVQAALNGVLGDRLQAQGNPLAMPLQVLPRPADEAGNEPATAPDLVLFAHGLCMAEGAWDNPAHHELAQALTTAGRQVAYLRYNSGRHISENGAALAQWLAAEEAAGRLGGLWLVGHSMGGLLIRSALAQAGNAAWTRRLRAAVYLGSPHQGAALERIGNHANRLLAVSPYTKPFMRLSNLRSQGIQDLRHGNIVEADWQGRQCPDDTADCRQVTRLSRRGRHWLIGATRDAQAPADPWAARGDDLVPLASALGLCAQGRHALDGPAVERRVLADTGHLALLSAPQVQPLLREALQLDPS